MSIGLTCGKSFGDYCLTTTTTSTSKAKQDEHQQHQQQHQQREVMQNLQQLVFKDVPDGNIPVSEIHTALQSGDDAK
jgi:hypothetical protein